MTYDLQLLNVADAFSECVSLGKRYYGSLWHNPLFMKEVARLHNLAAYQLICRKGQEVVAVLPLYEKSFLSYRTLVKPVSSYYQAICFKFEEESSEARRLLDTLSITSDIARFLDSKYKKLQITLSPENLDTRGFLWNSLNARPLYTFRQVVSEPLNPLRDEREKLKKAEQEGYHFGEEYVPKRFFELQKALDGKKNRALGVSYKGLTGLFNALHQAGLVRQFNLYQGKTIVSSNILLHDGGDVAFSILRATDAEALKKGASSYHSMCLIKAMSDSCRILDFCGANVPDVARFKAALGMELTAFFQIYK
ncbi:MAG TPA: hypothetical protein PL188_01575 [Candidatus Cloacimonadota bacterium]|nr:hypothetical protein [Candidatus Cloacimonadota bacterium]